jgi:hypothetical protein
MTSGSLVASRRATGPLCLVASLALLLGACTPYAVATTARPLARGERSFTQMLTVVPGGARFAGDSSTVAVPGIDFEQRIGLDDRTDIGVRIPTLSGAIVTWKRRLDAPSSRAGRATALLLGGGIVNLGQHAHLEATLVTSGDEASTVVPYGGLRALQVIPIASEAVSDSPTIGGFGGVRFGDRDGGVSLELGVFYDRSALKLRRGDLVIVPSVSLHGLSLLRSVGRGAGR